jgi:putative ABC transport system substrate-binding protein
VILALLASPLSGEAQQEVPKVPRIGLIRPGSPPDPNAEAFVQGLRDLGEVEGRTIAIEYRWAQGEPERIPKFAEELVRLKVDVIVTANVSQAAKRVPRTIPLVSPALDEGLVASLARPGGNITGLAIMARELSAKRLELLKETLPKVSRVAILRDPRTSWSVEATEAVARARGVDLQILEVRNLDDLDKAFSGAQQAQAGAVNIVDSSFFAANRARFVDAARKARLPAIYQSRAFVEAGGLMSYGPDIPDLFRRAARYVDMILKGAKPADLPIERPSKFEFVINMKTAKALGLTFPPSVLVRASEIIE